MSLYLLTRDDWDYEEDDAAVIRAESEQEAREIAEQNLKAPTGDWLRETTTCVLLSERGDACVILKSGRPG